MRSSNRDSHLITPSNFYLVITFVAALSGILFGYDTGVISGAILFIAKEFNLSAQMNGLVVSAVLIGAFSGAIFSGRLADHYGRKQMLIFDAVIFIIGSIITAVTPNIPLMIVGRIIVGIAVGIASYMGPLYISEIAPIKYRGGLVSLNQIAIEIGLLLAYIVDFYAAPSGAWRWMFAIGIFPALGLFIGMIFLPQSPRWLLSKGNEKEAHAILEKIRGHSPLVEKEFELIKKSLQQQKGTWRMLFSYPIYRTLIIGGGLAFIQQVTGINTIIYYAPTIFKLAGYSTHSAILVSIYVGVVFVLSTTIAVFLVDKFGRRPLLLAGVFIMTICLAIFSFSFYVEAKTFWIKWLTLASMLIYIIGFGISLGPIMWLMIAEIFPLRVRGLGSSIATSINWGSNWLVTFTFLTLIQYFNISGTFLIYAVFSILSLFFIYFYVPETRGVSLEEIEMNLYAGKPLRHLGAPE